MSNVVLTIGTRRFSVACADGEEERISKLGAMIDRKVGLLGDNAGQNEVRMLLYAALVLADELDEANAASAREAASPAPDGLADRLGSIAGKLENLAAMLERQRATS